MNIINFKSIASSKKITLDKINKHLKKEAKIINCNIQIIQTGDENRAVKEIYRKRKKITGIIIFPGVWQKTAYIMQETLEILKTPYITISTGENANLLKGIDNIYEKNIFEGCSKALKILSVSI